MLNFDCEMRYKKEKNDCGRENIYFFSKSMVLLRIRVHSNETALCANNRIIQNHNDQQTWLHFSFKKNPHIF